MAKKKKSLVEMYRIKEGPYDDINKSLSTAKSVAGTPQAQKPRVGADGASQKAQTDLDNSKSIFDEGSPWGEKGDIELSLTKQEANALAAFLDHRDDLRSKLSGLMPALDALSDKLGDAGAQGTAGAMDSRDTSAASNNFSSGYRGKLGIR